MSDAIRLRFAGAYRDSISAAYPLGDGYRWYLPRLMRFNAPDEDSPFDAGGLHPYAYCGDDPVNHRDPTGHFSFGVLRRLFSSDAHELDSLAGQGAARAGADAAATPGREQPPPAYREQATSHELPPPYRQLDPYYRAPLPSFREAVSIRFYTEVRRDLARLTRDISTEWLRRYSSFLPAEAKLPSARDLTGAFFADAHEYCRLRARRAAELMRRNQNSKDYRVRLNYIERRMREQTVLDGEAFLKRALEETLKETKRLYRTLKS